MELNPDFRFLLKWGEDRLKSAGLEDHRLSSEVLLGHIVGFSRSELLTNQEVKPDESTIKEYRDLIEKRADRVPLQYLTGETEFYNITLRCDPRAMIPRPETEVLVECLIGRLKDRENRSILDIGTGSGNIAIALAVNIHGATVTAIDISEEALDLARSNADLNGVVDKLRFVKGDMEDEEFIGSLGRFDCVVSNPPYVPESQRAILQPEVVKYEPGIALFSGENPLRLFGIIVGTSKKMLGNGGMLAFEVGLGQALEVSELLRRNSFENIEIVRDLAGIERIVLGSLPRASTG